MKNKKVEIELQTVEIPTYLAGEGGYYLNGKQWTNATLYSAAEGLEQFDLPLCSIELNFSPWTMGSLKWILYHIKRIEKCDLSYPVIQNPDGVIIDGWHRVAKAILDDKLTIKAVRLKVMPEYDELLKEEE